MRKDINYTGRLEIPASLVEASHQLQGDKAFISLKWNFSTLNFEPNHQVVCDVFVKNTSESYRYEIGKVSQSSSYLIDISNMRKPMNSRIRLKVVDKSSGIPIIRGVIDNLTPDLPFELGTAKSLLPIRKEPDLITPWSLDFESGCPVLLVSDRDNLYELLRSESKAPWFYLVIMHKVMEEIFVWLTNLDSSEITEKIEKWKNLFIDEYGCPRDFFDRIEESTVANRSEDVSDTTRRIGESVSEKRNHLAKLLDYFKTVEEEQG